MASTRSRSPHTNTTTGTSIATAGHMCGTAEGHLWGNVPEDGMWEAWARAGGGWEVGPPALLVAYDLIH
jgi:hypothetical protein